MRVDGEDGGESRGGGFRSGGGFGGSGFRGKSTYFILIFLKKFYLNSTNVLNIVKTVQLDFASTQQFLSCNFHNII